MLWVWVWVYNKAAVPTTPVTRATRSLVVTGSGAVMTIGTGIVWEISGEGMGMKVSWYHD